MSAIESIISLAVCILAPVAIVFRNRREEYQSIIRKKHETKDGCQKGIKYLPDREPPIPPWHRKETQDGET